MNHNANVHSDIPVTNSIPSYGVDNEVMPNGSDDNSFCVARTLDRLFVNRSCCNFDNELDAFSSVVPSMIVVDVSSMG